MRSNDPDARLAERALRERWPVPPDKLAGLVQVLVDLAESPATKPRERIAAVKALLAASKLNLDTLRVSMLAGEYEALSARLGALLGQSAAPTEGEGGGSCRLGGSDR